MKEKILMFVIGALIGAIITAACFLILKPVTNPEQVQGFEFRGEKGGMRPGKMQNDKTIPNNSEIDNSFNRNVEPPTNEQMPENIKKQDSNKSQSQM